MSALKWILVHMDTTSQAAERLRLAHGLAQLHGAELTALYAVTPPYLLYPYAYAVSGEIAPVLQEVETDQLGRARAQFDKAMTTLHPPVEWRIASGEPIGAFSRQALVADLVVVGQADPEPEGPPDVPSDFADAVLNESGRPALVVPFIGAREPLDRVAVVAWKPTRESARALAAALPLLQRCAEVHLATWDDGDQGEEGPAPDVVGHLRRHGIEAVVHHHGPAGSEVGEQLLSRCADFGAGLLVMGCYGHTRARERVLGGVTRTVLQSMTLPVLMAH